MYGFDWIRWFRRPGGRATAPQKWRVHPVVKGLGATSLLTDVSSEMVSSLLPLYLVLHLHLSPLQFGAIDGIYNGFATLLVALAAGWYADRANRRKHIATAGYALSALCKLLLILAGSAWGWIMLVTGLDRLGKGLRGAPRDALISLHTPPEHLATAFGIHRAMDAAGAMLGPLLAFLLIAAFPAGFELVWLVSFVFAALGVAAIVLLVPAREAVAVAPGIQAGVDHAPRPAMLTRRFNILLACAAALAACTISDNFVYLLLQEQIAGSASYLPLFPVVTAGSYMLFAVPVSQLADRAGRAGVMLGGYAVLAVLYIAFAMAQLRGVATLAACLVLLGLYYAATEGVLVALASRELPASRRTAGIALLATAVGLGKMLSSVAFGWIWTTHSWQVATMVFLILLLLGGGIVTLVLGKWHD